MSTLDTTFDALKAAHTNYKTEVLREKSDLDATRAELVRARGELQQVHAELATMKSQHAEVSAKLGAASSNLDNWKKALNEGLASAKQSDARVL
jgi:predicted  nucleic acid-binding Zn-ribbon protein